MSSESHALVARLVGSDVRVLELGCAVGAMTETLSQEGCSVVAVERDPAAAAVALAFAERVIVADLDGDDYVNELGEDTFDVVVAADVLEHLQRPVAVLRDTTSRLRQNGVVVISLPNVAHAAVRLALLGGAFPYGQYGLLDRTHIHFYTLESALELIESAGLWVTELERVVVPVSEALVPIDLAALPTGIEQWAIVQPEATTFQFVFRCTPRSDATRPVEEAASERDWARVEDPVAVLQARALIQLDADMQARDAQIQAQSGDIEALRRERDVLAARIDELSRRTADAEALIRAYEGTRVMRLYRARDRLMGRRAKEDRHP